MATSEYTREFEPQLEAARDGSESAWAAIYARLAPQVLGYLRASGAIEPEDTLSEVFLQVARDLPRFEGEERDFRAWAFTIAQHRLIDARRAAARRPADPVAEVPEPDAAPLDDAADEALARIGRDEILHVLAQLTPDQRSVLLLRLLGGLTVDEVAAVVCKRPGAVKALQRRGLAAVRRELSGAAVTL